MLTFLKTIRAKLIFSFIIFFILIGGIILIDFWSEYKSNRIQEINDRLSRIELNTQTAKKLEYFFLNNETISSEFYESGLSENLEARSEHIKQIQSDLKFLQENVSTEANKNILNDLSSSVANYENVFNELIKTIKLRGFKGYGKEGEMRDYIHKIEKNPQINQVLLLSIRRHEKDFIIRKQENYISKLSKTVQKLEKTLPPNTSLKQLLKDYEQSFQELAKLEKVIGFDNKSGLKGKLLTIEQDIEKVVKKLSNAIRAESANITLQNEIIQIIVVIICSLFTLFFAYYLTKLLSQPIAQLSTAIHEVIESDFNQPLNLEENTREDEIGLLSQDVDKLVSQVQKSFGDVKLYSEQIEEKQKILMNGVDYAKRIQSAILPTQDLSEHFRKVGVLFRPQYDVSGDFYWFTQRNDSLYVAVGDCTGKGVAGAVMGMIANTLLNDVVNKQKTSKPAEILSRLDTEFQEALSSQHSEDSVEVALCRFETSDEEKSKYKVTFAGARSNILYSDGWEINELKGDRHLIGGRKHQKVEFNEQSFYIKKENFIYFVTDGLINQPDADKKRFGSKRLKEILSKILHLPIKEQVQRIEDQVNLTLQDSKQRDDITALILKA